MQSLAWYIRRLSAMPAAEIAWRIRSSMRDRVDRLLVNARGRQRRPEEFLDNNRPDEPGFRATSVPVGAWTDGAAPHPDWLSALTSRADRIAEHRLSFFDLDDHHLGDPIDWNRDHKRQQPTPTSYAANIDYRDVREAGDCKFVWEPNRHHHLVVLAQAYRATREKRYAAAVAEQLESWLDQCPFGTGMNWRSPLELGIRLINWVWALDMTREADALSSDLRARLLYSVYLHTWEIARKYSQASSANNHLIGEAAGVFVAACYFRNLKHADRWRDEALTILTEQALAQSYADGGTREQALGYQLFVLQFFLVALIVARRANVSVSASFEQRVAKMLAFIGTLSEAGHLPLFGDDDSGYVLDLGGQRNDPRWLLVTGAALVELPPFESVSDTSYPAPAYWLLGPDQRKHDVIAGDSVTPGIGPHAFPESGYYLLQSGADSWADSRISVVFDCGELGFGALAAHGHADALSFTMRAFGDDVFVDPGTYDYFSYPEWREYFRSTRAHNTVVIDGLDQSEMLGPFLWGRRATASCELWAPTCNGGRVRGQHTGYHRLTPPVMHRRTLELDGASGRLVITDELAGCANRRVQVVFHLAETCHVVETDGQRVRIDTGHGRVTLEFDERLSVDRLSGSTQPIAGWVSRGYHQKTPSTTLIGEILPNETEVELVCRVEIDRA